MQTAGLIIISVGRRRLRKQKKTAERAEQLPSPCSKTAGFGEMCAEIGRNIMEFTIKIGTWVIDISISYQYIELYWYIIGISISWILWNVVECSFAGHNLGMIGRIANVDRPKAWSSVRAQPTRHGGNFWRRKISETWISHTRHKIDRLRMIKID